jgi:hypothetical protein
MNPNATGAQVVELYGGPDNPRPYRISNGDEYKCPKCGLRVVTNFGTGGGHMKHSPGFEERIAVLREQDDPPVYWTLERYIRKQEEEKEDDDERRG